MVLVDTTVWVDHIRGVHNAETDWLDFQFAHQPIGLTDLILCEVLQGIRDDAAFRTLTRHLLLFEVHSTAGSDLAIASAQNFRLLRKKGLTVRKTIDCITATFCLLKGHSLLHRDRDFDPFEQYLGLSVIHP